MSADLQLKNGYPMHSSTHTQAAAMKVLGVVLVLSCSLLNTTFAAGENFIAPHLKPGASSTWTGTTSKHQYLLRSIRGGGKNGNGDDEFALDAEQVIPLVSTLAPLALGLDVVLNPKDVGKYFEDDPSLTPVDKTMAIAKGAQYILNSLAIVAMVAIGDKRTLQAANALCIVNALAHEAVSQVSERVDGFGPLNKKYQNVCSFIHAATVAAAGWALWGLREKDEED